MIHRVVVIASDSFDAIAQLSDIAGPEVSLRCRVGGRGKSSSIGVQPGGEIGKYAIHQPGMSASSLTQRRNVQASTLMR